ncbi:hypothetical protein [Ornithinimicrobium sediminis]|uniref:hypothetical protein n=1 Tax=Ornithinimicrobium sediminis TaxID=2904603 RepID=UPI001E5FC033|nr:hypothetical protein [Ornithinimicrobium sediminis]MCE0485908.1 hypothetical protein [Ornithinimicrobium sediminis]
MNAQPFGDLPEEARALYRRVLRSLPAPVEEHAEDLGWPVDHARATLTVLRDLGLVHVDPEGRPRAEDPRAGVGRLLSRAEADLDAWREQLLSLRESLSGFEADYRKGLELSGPRVPMFEEVTSARVPEVLQVLARTSTGTIAQVNAEVGAGPGLDPLVRSEREASLAAGREHRSIFGLGVLTDPAGVSYLEERAASGERQRYLEHVPVEFAAFGDAAVVVSHGVVPLEDFLLVRSPVVVQVFLALFDELWRRAEPVHHADTTAQTRRMLELLALGFKDEAIARQLGLGLRTVRRRVADLMDDYGVDTRFQLGLALGRLGTLE